MQATAVKRPSPSRPQWSSPQQAELQRLAELGRLSATLLHEISNPLTAALLHLENAGHDPASLREARRSIKTLKRYVEAARQQVRKQSTLTDFKITTSLAQIKRVIIPLAKKAGVNLVFSSVPDCRLYGDPVKFQQVLANLIVNAIEAYQNQPADRLAKPVHVQISAAAHTLMIEVSDWGQGIDQAQIAHIFEPFYTTKSQAGHGLGIGLAIVRQYVTDDFGGSISVRSSSRHGTTFSVIMPALYRPASQERTVK